MLKKKKILKKQIYLFVRPEERLVVCSGITFAEFYGFISPPINTLLLISGNGHEILSETEFIRGFDLISSEKQMSELCKPQALRNVGDFCFIDLQEKSQLEHLTEQNLAELLYMAHFFCSLNTPFFETIHNRFAYLSHDDGWYSKIYCQNPYDFIDVVLGVMNGARKTTDRNVKDDLWEFMQQGVLIEADSNTGDCEKRNAVIYPIGIFEDMDYVFNRIESLKKTTKAYYF